MAKAIMIQRIMSNAAKSLLAAGLCRIFKQDGYRVVGLEQSSKSIALPAYKAPAKVALLLGEEVDGITPDLLAKCDDLIEIPMFGQKESFNVSVATGIALYQLIQ